MIKKALLGALGGMGCLVFTFVLLILFAALLHNYPLIAIGLVIVLVGGGIGAACATDGFRE